MTIKELQRVTSRRIKGMTAPEVVKCRGKVIAVLTPIKEVKDDHAIQR